MKIKELKTGSRVCDEKTCNHLIHKGAMCLDWKGGTYCSECGLLIVAKALEGAMFILEHGEETEVAHDQSQKV